MANSQPPGSDTTTKSQPKHFDSNDEPISPGKDNLGYAAYAEVLTNRITSAQPPVTIGISGSWGSGKTSLMKLIEFELGAHQVFCRATGKFLGRYSPEELPKEIPCPHHDSATKHRAKEYSVKVPFPDVRSIWVNVWQLNSQEEVWDAFVQSLVTHVRKEMKWWKRIRFKVAANQLLRSSYLLALAIVPALVGTYLGKEPNTKANWTDVLQVLTFRGSFNAPAPMVGALLTYGLALWAIRQQIKAAWQFDIKKILVTGSYEARITELGNLSNQFAEFVESLVGKNGRLVVFIDDLDRCSPRVIPQVLEAIKVFAASDKCVYVLGIDYGVVWKAIKEGYSFPNEEDGARYLEKIIQVPFQLPALSPAAVSYYIRVLSPDLHDGVKDVFALGLESNPRVLKRAIQIYYTWMDLAERGLQRWEVDPVEPELVAKWLTIQSRYPKVSEFVARRKEFLLWLERNALYKANQKRRLIDESDLRLLPEAEEKADQDAPKQEPAVWENLEALLFSGKHRFSRRPFRDTLDSYIYLGGSVAGVEGEVRAQSRERSMLLANDDKEQQKFINQLFVYRGIGKYRKLWPPSVRINAYRERLNSAAGEPGVLTKEECVLVPAVQEALNNESKVNRDYVYHLDLRIPSHMNHAFGAAEDETNQAVKDGLDPELAIRERAWPRINIPSFRIGQYPVTNDEFQAFVSDTNKSETAEPFSIVEYEAYCEPVFETEWETRSDPQTDSETDREITFPDLKEQPLKLKLVIRFAKLEVSLFSPQGGEAGHLSIPLLRRVSDVVRANGLILLVTVGSAYEIESPNTPVQGSFTILVKIWRDDQTITLNRRNEIPTDYRLSDHPVANVSWYDAVAYCIWLRRRSGKPYRLPKEPEWEAAATGDARLKNIYPWGDTWIPALANTKESGLDATVPVGSFSPEGDSPFAVADMVGNVWEWCADVFGEVRPPTAYSGLLWEDVRFRASGEIGHENITRSVRGGSFLETKAFARTKCRNSFPPDHKSASVGFRVAIASELEGLDKK